MPTIELSNIQLGSFQRPTADHETASKFIKALPGRICLEFAPPVAKYGSLFIPDHLAKEMRADCGTVLASGVGEIQPGMVVIQRPGDGLWVRSIKAGDYETPKDCLVAWHGVFVDLLAPGYPYIYQWYDSIVLIWNEDDTFTPTGDNILFRAEPKQKQNESGIYIPDKSQQRSVKAEVVAIGPLVTEVKVGDQISYHIDAPVDIDLSFWGEKDLAVMRISGVESIYVA